MRFLVTCSETYKNTISDDFVGTALYAECPSMCFVMNNIAYLITLRMEIRMMISRS